MVAIIGILAAIAIPRFAELLRKSSEGATKGSLGAMRSALSIYYSDMDGQYPSDPASLSVNGKYLDAIPVVKTPNYHPDSGGILLGSMAGGFTDAGGWAYDAAFGDADFGSVFVNCTHTDTKASTWESY